MKYMTLIACFVFLFSNCLDPTVNEKSGENSFEKTFIEMGQKVAGTTFATLSSNLQNAMKEGGVSYALEYCNVEAYPLVDSLEKVHQVNIKRTSLKVRNPNNRPTKEEEIQLQLYRKQFESGKELKPVIKKNAKQIEFYAPIRVMELCGKCHGKVGEQLMQKDHELIQRLYPSDRAINYKVGDLRGMWSITFYEK